MNNYPLLVGNTFSPTLMRRALRVIPVSLADLRAAAVGRRIISFWGHVNSLAAVNAATGLDLSPERNRPVLTLSADGRPVLDGMVFNECWVISPDYRSGFRPAVGEEVTIDKIAGWQILKLSWE